MANETNNKQYTKNATTPKKTVPLLLSTLLTVCFGLSGCGQSDDDRSSSTTSSSSAGQSSSATSSVSSTSSTQASNQESSVSSSSNSSVSGGKPSLGLIINEIAATNTYFFDSDGDTPDWVELFNPGSEPVSLLDWGLSDDETDPFKWRFPDIKVAPGEYLQIWASDKDRFEIANYRALISANDTVRYIVPDEDTPAFWMTTDFDDSTWLQGTNGIGFGDDDDGTQLSDRPSAVFIRKSFNLDSALEAVTGLILHLDYDDGFVAYLNGNEIARANMEDVTFDVLASAEHEATGYQSGTIEALDISEFQDLLVPGQNTLAIQVHNASATSSDLSSNVLLTMATNTPTQEGSPVDPALGFGQSEYHTNFKLSSSGETIVLHDPSGTLVSVFTSYEVPDNISLGLSRVSGDIVLYNEPTPGEENAANEYIGVTQSTVSFSQDGGVLSSSMVMLEGGEDGEFIRYSLDASPPSESSEIYTSPIDTSTNKVVRARVFKEGYLPGPVASRSFLPESEHDIAVVSLVTDPLNFFDLDFGIYTYGTNYERQAPFYGANFWQDWERPVQVSLYETDGQLAIDQEMGVKIFGGWSRSNAQRSLALFARSEYGSKKIEYPIFPQRPYEEYKSVVLRNSGNDWMTTMLRDVAMTSLMEGANLEVQAHRPVAVYLNNEYWGLYNLREKVNEHFLASKFDVDKDDIDLLGVDTNEGLNAVIIEGKNDDYLELLNLLETAPIVENEVWEQIDAAMDIDNFTIYQIAQIYFNNTDWPGNNTKFWKSPTTKWRWILYDTDFGFSLYDSRGYSNNTFTHALATNSNANANPPWSTFMLRRLLENPQYQLDFINRFADELNSRFQSARVREHIESLAQNIEVEMPLQINRWAAEANKDPDSPRNPYSWEDEVAKMLNFAELRPDYVRQHISAYFDLEDSVNLTVNMSDTNVGAVKLNSLTLTENAWTGQYFPGIPIQLEALAHDGFQFSHWLVDGEVTETVPSITLSLTSADTEVTAVFIEPSLVNEEVQP